MLTAFRLWAYSLPTPAFVAVSLGMSTVLVGTLAAAAWAAGLGPVWFAGVAPLGVVGVASDFEARRRHRLFNPAEAS